MPVINRQPLLSRRKFVSTAAVVSAAFVLTPPMRALAISGRRSLSFYHTHTKEILDIAYGWPGRYDPMALEQVNDFLKDFRTGEVHPIDPKLLDILFTVRQKVGGKGRFEVISGYRSPKTNQQLRQKSSGVAKHSLHMDGKAIDIRLTGVHTKKIQRCAQRLRCGGVGFYAQSNFVHLDTGRVRFW